MDAVGLAIHHPWWLWLLILAPAVYLLWKGGWRGRLFVLGMVLAVALTDILCAQVLKPLIARVRPCVALEGVRLLAGIKTSWSMPSNHAANTAAAATIVGFCYRRWLWLAVPIAALVAYSRVYVGVHYPLDVLLGAVIGVSVAAFVMIAIDAVTKRRNLKKPLGKQT